MGQKIKYYRCGRCQNRAAISIAERTNHSEAAAGSAAAAADAPYRLSCPKCAARLDEHDEVVRLTNALLPQIDLQDLRPDVDTFGQVQT